MALPLIDPTLDSSQLNTSDQWNEFVQMQSKLHDVNLELGRFDDCDEILKYAVILSRTRLGFDRVGMLMHDPEKDEILGTWGVDEYGKLSDEHHYHSPTKDSPWVAEVLNSHDYVALREDIDLKQWDKIVGKGWNAMAGMWDGEQCIGWVVCDNLITRAPLETWRRMILGEFTKNLGSLIIQTRQKQELKFINDNLEKLVDQKNAQLRLKVEQLEMAKDDLVEAEKLASLGGLVAGVAHEINTPVGIGITAASFLQEKAKEIHQAYDDRSMKKSQLVSFFEQVADSNNIILNNLNQAGNLIQSFKKIAVNQTHDVADQIQLHQVIEDLIISYKHSIKNRPIVINNNIDPQLSFKSFPGTINQIFSNLINNALLHGFENEDKGIINIDADLKEDQLNIVFSDNGKGVKESELQNIFNPFYTTKRGKGGTGLGLNIIHNLITKLQGSIKANHNFDSNDQAKGLKIEFNIKVNQHD